MIWFYCKLLYDPQTSLPKTQLLTSLISCILKHYKHQQDSKKTYTERWSFILKSNPLNWICSEIYLTRERQMLFLQGWSVVSYHSRINIWSVVSYHSRMNIWYLVSYHSRMNIWSVVSYHSIMNIWSITVWWTCGLSQYNEHLLCGL